MNSDNHAEMTKLSLSKPSFLLLHSKYCGHCTKIYPTWVELMEKYENNTDVVIGECECIDNKNECESILEIHQFPTFVLILNKKIIEIHPERTFDHFVYIADTIRTFDFNSKCMPYLGQADEFPIFIYFYNTTFDESCDFVSSMTKDIPGSHEHFYLEGNSTENSIEVYLSKTIGFVYDDSFQKDQISLFIYDFMLMPFGDWQIKKAKKSERRLALIIYNATEEINQFYNLAYNQTANFVFGKMQYSKFSNSFPDLHLISDVPFFIVSNEDKTKFYILKNSSTLPETDNILIFERISNGTVDKEMNYGLSPIIPSIYVPSTPKYNATKLFYIFAIVITIIIIVVLIYVLVFKELKTDKLE